MIFSGYSLAWIPLSGLRANDTMLDAGGSSSTGCRLEENNGYFLFGKAVGTGHNQLRPLEPDLDRFPISIPDGLEDFALDKKFATLIAGRGCIYNCVFCDIRKFYGQPYRTSETHKKSGKCG
jgi:hypothetical protein